LTASVEPAAIRPAATLTSRVSLPTEPNETPWLAVLAAKVGCAPPTVKFALAAVVRLAISLAPKTAPAPMATLLTPVLVAPAPMAMPPSDVACAAWPMAIVPLPLTLLPAVSPMAMFSLPVTETPALAPTAVLLLPTTSDEARAPSPVLPEPVTLLDEK
jgi:hypothetical protein